MTTFLKIISIINNMGNILRRVKKNILEKCMTFKI